MKVFFVLSFLFSLNVYSQDTLFISSAFNYLKTVEFKIALQNYFENRIQNDIKEYSAIRKRANDYRKEQLSRANFWTNANCFVPDTIYYVPVQSSKVLNHPIDSLAFRDFNKVFYKKVGTPCQKVSIIEVYILSPNVIELRHFSGTKDGLMWFGDDNVLRLREANEHFEILFRGDTIYN